MRSRSGRTAISGLIALLGVAAICAPRPAVAHPSGLLTVRIEPQEDGIRVGVRGPAEGPIAIAGCAVDGPPVRPAAWRWQRWACPEGLLGAAFDLSALDPSGARVAVAVGGATHLVDPRAGLWRVPHEAPRSRGVLAAYLGLGIRHIAGGLDHLLFIAGLLFLVRGRRALLGAITAFTVAHSVTLAAGVLGAPMPAAAPIEAWIAGSLLLLGAELRRDGTSWSARHPAGLAAVFGLVHGLGFAGALVEAGVPDGARALALAGFNLGVEIGQLGFVGLGALVLWAGRARIAWLRTGAGWGIGVAGAVWLIERTAALG